MGKRIREQDSGREVRMQRIKKVRRRRRGKAGWRIRNWRGAKSKKKTEKQYKEIV